MLTSLGICGPEGWLVLRCTVGDLRWLFTCCPIGFRNCRFLLSTISSLLLNGFSHVDTRTSDAQNRAKNTHGSHIPTAGTY